MRVVSLSTWQEGGAAVAAKRLGNALIKHGVETTYLHMSTRLPAYLDATIGKLHRCDNPIFHSYNYYPDNLASRINSLKPDLVHVHWIGAGFMRPESIAKIKAPLVWTLHDLWPLSGAAHYPDSLDRFRDGYLPTNRPDGEVGPDLNRALWLRKRELLQDKQITFIAPSRYIADLARKSALSKHFTLQQIYNGISLADYSPTSQKKLNHLLFVAHSALIDRNKGYDLLVKALTKIPPDLADSLTLTVVGAAKPDHDQLAHVNKKVTYLPTVSSTKLRKLYSTSTLTIVPSRLESLSYVALESQASGTPVVAFRVGGIPEVVKHNQTGYLAKPLDSADLAKGISNLLSSKELLVEFGQAGRKLVEQQFSLVASTQAHLSLYEQLLR